MLILIYMCPVHIKSKLLSEAALYLLHLGIIPKRKMIYSVCKVKRMAIHIEFLDNRAVCMSGKMEISRDFVDNYCSFN